MSYFPLRILPQFEKFNAVGSSGFSGTIGADDYNLLSEEIIAMQTFLGVEAATSADELAVLQQSADSKNLIGVLRRLAEGMNVFVREGMNETSGYVHNGQRMIFPETTWATFLGTLPAPADRNIHVLSTAGFPDNGVITILNDMEMTAAATMTNVEWIRYNGKTGTQFLNCERGYLGTTVGTHGGSYKISAPKSDNYNLLDQCGIIPTGLNLCNRRYPGWRYKNQYSSLALGLFGSLIDIKRFVRNHPLSIKLTSAALGDLLEDVSDVADEVGILDTSTGTSILKSATPAYEALDQLTWSEASDFVDALLEEDLVTLIKAPSDWNVNKNPYIPVFQGRLGVSLSTAAVSLNMVSNKTTTSTATGTPTVVPNPFADGIAATSAALSGAKRIFRDSIGNIFFSEYAKVRKIDTSGKITTIAGTGTFGYSGDGGLAVQATLKYPMGIHIDPDTSDIYIADSGANVVRKIDGESGVITTIAGTGTAGHDLTGVATSAKLQSPTAVWYDSYRQSVLIADYYNNCIKEVNSLGNISKLGDVARPADIVTDGANIFVAAQWSVLQREAGSSIFKLIGGNGSSGISLSGGQIAPPFYGDSGPAAILTVVDARSQMTIDAYGNIWVAETSTGAIRVIVRAVSYDFVAADIGKIFTAVANDRGFVVSDPAIINGMIGVAVTGAGDNLVVYGLANTTGGLRIKKYSFVEDEEIETIAGGGTIPSTSAGSVPSASTTSTTAAATPDPTLIQSLGIVQTADGRLYSSITTDSTQTNTDQSVIAYKTFFVQSPVTDQERSQA